MKKMIISLLAINFCLTANTMEITNFTTCLKKDHPSFLKSKNEIILTIAVDFIMQEHFVYHKLKNNINGEYYLSDTGEKIMVVRSLDEAITIIGKNGFGDFSTTRIFIQTISGSELGYKIQYDSANNTYTKSN